MKGNKMKNARRSTTITAQRRMQAGAQKANSWVAEFILPRRLHRLAYFLRLVAANGVTAFVCANGATMAPLFWWPSIILIPIYSTFFVALPRIRDVGMSTWCLTACFVPFVNVVFGIILLFRSPTLRSFSKP
jgi:hypothetical protein